jgi:hypothetical protein
MPERYRVTVQNERPETYASLWGAAERWREAGGNAVVEEISADNFVKRTVPFLELRRVVDRERGQSCA